MYTVSKPRGPWQTAAMTRDRGLRSVVIRIEPECVAVRPKGTRAWRRLPWGTVYLMAVRAEVDSMRRAKAAKRKAGAQ